MMVSLLQRDGRTLLEWRGFAAGPNGKACRDACEARARSVLAMAARAAASTRPDGAPAAWPACEAFVDERHADLAGSCETAYVGKALIEANQDPSGRTVRREAKIAAAAKALLAAPALLRAADSHDGDVAVETEVWAKSCTWKSNGEFAFEATSNTYADLGQGRRFGAVADGPEADAAMAIALLLSAQERAIRSHRAKRTSMSLPRSATLRAAALSEARSAKADPAALDLIKAIVEGSGSNGGERAA